METEMTLNRAAGNVYPLKYNADFTETPEFTVKSEIELARLISIDMTEVTDRVARVEVDYQGQLEAYHGTR
jgi:hypothetical protein